MDDRIDVGSREVDSGVEPPFAGWLPQPCCVPRFEIDTNEITLVQQAKVTPRRRDQDVRPLGAPEADVAGGAVAQSGFDQPTPYLEDLLGRSHSPLLSLPKGPSGHGA